MARCTDDVKYDDHDERSWWSSWSTIGKNVINRAGDLPMDDVHPQNLTGLETGGFWSLDCLKRLDCAVYKILVCRFPIYLFLLPFPQNSLLFYPNWPGDKLLVMLWAVFSEQGHSMHSAKFWPWLVWTVMEGSISPRSPLQHPVAQRDRAAMFWFSHPAHLQSDSAAILRCWIRELSKIIFCNTYIRNIFWFLHLQSVGAAMQMLEKEICQNAK